METRPFDPAAYLDGEDAIAAYLADARADGEAALAEARMVVERSRSMNRGEQRPGGETQTTHPQSGVAEAPGASEFRYPDHRGDPGPTDP